MFDTINSDIDNVHFGKTTRNTTNYYHAQVLLCANFFKSFAYEVDKNADLLAKTTTLSGLLFDLEKEPKQSYLDQLKSILNEMQDNSQTLKFDKVRQLALTATQQYFDEYHKENSDKSKSEDEKPSGSEENEIPDDQELRQDDADAEGNVSTASESEDGESDHEEDKAEKQDDFGIPMHV
ncbi:hypothetical protein Ciccas_012452 [Cichlidogyrus casuarinus]|uniref:Uncharacterized protein n=1 Tax=Cichlidogyrus casuarinus TaxID=1844966 RepID=A0ABD2PTB6_9PLAT